MKKKPKNQKKLRNILVNQEGPINLRERENQEILNLTQNVMIKQEKINQERRRPNPIDPLKNQ